MTNKNSQLKSLLTDESFQRWLSGTATTEEKRKWVEWKNSKPGNKILYQRAVFVWKAIQFRLVKNPMIKQEWLKLKNRIKADANAGSYKSAERFISDKLAENQRKKKIWLKGLAIAACFFLAILIWYFSTKTNNYFDVPKFSYVQTEYGQRQTITLNQDIKITLNANSWLKYSKKKNEPIRINLKGEAYFDVNHRPGQSKNKLTVHTCDGAIDVIGTKFVVYERNTGTKVAVEEGCLRITVAEKQQNQSRKKGASISLKSGNLVWLKRGDSSLKPYPVNVNVHTSWQSDQLIFDNTKFQNIVRRLSETYNVQFDVENELLEQTISGSVENSQLDVIIHALAKALQASVNRSGNQITIKSATR